MRRRLLYSLTVVFGVLGACACLLFYGTASFRRENASKQRTATDARESAKPRTDLTNSTVAPEPLGGSAAPPNRQSSDLPVSADGSSQSPSHGLQATKSSQPTVCSEASLWPRGNPYYERFARIALVPGDPVTIRRGLQEYLMATDVPAEFRALAELHLAGTYFRQGQLDIALSMVRDMEMRYADTDTIHVDVSWLGELNDYGPSLTPRHLSLLERRIAYTRGHSDAAIDYALTVAGQWAASVGRTSDAESLLNAVVGRQYGKKYFDDDVRWMLKDNSETSAWSLPEGATGFFPSDPTSYRCEDIAARRLIDLYATQGRVADVCRAYDALIQKWECVAPVELLRKYAGTLESMGETARARQVLQRGIEMGERVLTDVRFQPLNDEACRASLEQTRRMLEYLENK